ncbi:hypothetical protein FRB99_007251, partial [Tulasnella sp. 403]
TFQNPTPSSLLAFMEAYYQRQRLPPPTQSFLDDLDGVPRSPPGNDSQQTQRNQSFLIFPVTPAAPAQQQPSPAVPKVPSPISPSNSSSSLPASLLASVARRSDSRDPPGSARSGSREGLGSDWEEMRGPLPLPQQRRSRGRPRLSERSSYSALAGRTPLAPLSEDDQRERLERSGIGWDWTLDREDTAGPSDMLLSWQRRMSAASSDGFPSDLEGDTQYEDASSQFHYSLSTGSPVGETNSEASVESPGVRLTLASPRGRQMRTAEGPPRMRRFSFRLSSPSSRAAREARAARSRTPRPPPRPALPLPFGTLIQALLTIDKSTIELLEQVESPTTPRQDAPPQYTELFGIQDDIVTENTTDAKAAAAQHEAGQVMRLLAPEATESALQADRTLLKGFEATHFFPTNPFALPFYLLNLGWEYGLKSVMALHPGRKEYDVV